MVRAAAATLGKKFQRRSSPSSSSSHFRPPSSGQAGTFRSLTHADRHPGGQTSRRAFHHQYHPFASFLLHHSDYTITSPPHPSTFTHHTMAGTPGQFIPPGFSCAILTISDTASQDPDTDASGQLLKRHFKFAPNASLRVVDCAIVPDEPDQIQQKVKEWIDEKKIKLILTTGGTGFGMRDGTPEVSPRSAISCPPCMVPCLSAHIHSLTTFTSHRHSLHSSPSLHQVSLRLSPPMVCPRRHLQLCHAWYRVSDKCLLLLANLFTVVRAL